MKSLLLTGASGFIGSYLKTALSAHYRVITVSRSEGVDIAAPDALERAVQEPVDLIVHAAATASDDADEAYRVNVEGTYRVCAFAKTRGVKHLVLLSTIFAIDHEQNGYFNTYGKSKKMAEEIAETYCSDAAIALSILRLAQVYDEARLAQKGQPMLYFFVDTIGQKGEITLFGKRNPLRNFIHIDYLCDVVKEVLAHTLTGVWHVVEERDHTVAEIAYMLFALYGKTPCIRYATDKPDIPSVYIPSKRRFESASVAPIALYEGLERIIRHGNTTL